MGFLSIGDVRIAFMFLFFSLSLSLSRVLESVWLSVRRGKLS